MTKEIEKPEIDNPIWTLSNTIQSMMGISNNLQAEQTELKERISVRHYLFLDKFPTNKFSFFTHFYAL